MFDRLRTRIWHARDAVRDYIRSGHRQEVFTRIYDQNLWGSQGTLPGARGGSSAAATAAVVAALPALWKQYSIRTLVDAPCGDCSWMSRIAGTLDRYVGVDIVPALIEGNRVKYAELTFECADLTSDVLPKADAIFCRDCFQHLPTRLILSALDNFRVSGARWVFLTSNGDVGRYQDVVIGGSRPVNLQLPPFNFPPAFATIAEDDTGRYLASGL